MPLHVATPNDTTVVVTREFNAPRQMIWDCHTKPELIQRWLLGPPGWSMPVCEVDLRVGGAYRYRWRNEEDGAEFGSAGVHREIEPIELIVTTERMEGFEGEAINTMRLSECGGKTILTLSMDFGSKAARDGAIGSGMTGGMEQSYARLEETIAAGL